MSRDSLEDLMAERFPEFNWLSTWGSGESAEYTLASDTEYLILDHELSVVHRRDKKEVARSASYLDSMETED